MYYHDLTHVFVSFLCNLNPPPPSLQSIQLFVYSYRPFSQIMFMLSIAINRAEHVWPDNYMLMCNIKIAINIMLCLLNSTGHI